MAESTGATTTGTTGGSRRGRRRAAAALAVGVVLVATAAGTASGLRGEPPPPDAAVHLQAEVDAMLSAGLADDDPKVTMLQDEADALAASAQAPPAPDSVLEVQPRGARGPLAASPREAARLAPEVNAGPAAEAGVVDCEPVPQHLDADEVAGAVCLSVPQPDGTSRYIAIDRTGRVRVVTFGDGGVDRLADRDLPVDAEPAEVDLTPRADGDLGVRDGAEAATLDLG